MQTPLRDSRTKGRFSCHLVRPERVVPSLADDARAGLLAPPRGLPPKYFYDRHGSALFDRICTTPEYYVTRTESALLAARADAIIDASSPDHILELGSGASRKTHHLLRACEARRSPCTFWPYDVCESILIEAGERLRAAFQWLDVNALVGDYHAGFRYLPEPRGRCLYAFLGSTIGNFGKSEAVALLQELRLKMREGDSLLLGADRVKERTVLQAAYNDAAGLTAAFNLNLLRVLNRELDADFSLEAFEHEALYDEASRQVEMYLVARRRQVVHLGVLEERVYLQAGERILTEISRKFTPEDLNTLLEEAGFDITAHYQAPDAYFSLILAHPRGVNGVQVKSRPSDIGAPAP